jgi:hypothetical protein
LGEGHLKKLFSLKEWITVPEAARHLSLLFGEDVNEADVLRLALDGQLKLSLNLVNGAQCLRGPLVSGEDAKRDTNSLDEHGRHPIKGSIIDDGRVIECGTEVKFVDGVWDLSMLGTERTDIENKYQALTNGPGVRSLSFSGPILCRDDGTHCEILTPREENKGWPYLRANYHFAKSLPADSVLVVRTSALRDLEARVSEPGQRGEKPIGQRERNTLLVIIAALAELAEIDLKKPSKAASAIEAQTALMGARVANRTIEEHLKRITEALEGRSG